MKVLAIGYLKPYKIEIDGKKATMKNHIVLGVLETENNSFSGTEYTDTNEEMGQVNFEKIGNECSRFHIIDR